LDGTVAANVLAHGTGALHIDACRIPAGDPDAATRTPRAEPDGRADGRQPVTRRDDAGRWPTNLVLSHAPALDADGAVVGDGCNEGCVPGCPVAELDRHSGILSSGANPARRRSDKFRDTYAAFKGQARITPARGADSGGASRFYPVFRYEPKAPTSERPRVGGVAHPTVKPLGLMRWLVRLVAPPGATVLDPFAGSGTTAQACALEGVSCIAGEREAPYLPLILARLSTPAPAHPDRDPGHGRPWIDR
jgi:hypothetical protein